MISIKNAQYLDGKLHCITGPAVFDLYFLLGHEMSKNCWESLKNNYANYLKPSKDVVSLIQY